jgi:endonuclease III
MMVRGLVPRQPAKSGRQEGSGMPPSQVHARNRPRTTAGKAKPPFTERNARRVPRASKLSPSKARYQPTSPERVAEILQRLDELYPNATCALKHSNAWELLVATILSAQCTDVRVNLVTPQLFKKYPTPQAFAALQPEELEPQIRSTGFFRNKSKSVVGAARKLVEEFQGQVPDAMEKLLTLPGVARKTANVVLGTWFRKAEGIVVDTHVHRISRRLELTRNDDPQKIEQDLMRVIPREKWIPFAHQIIWHGRALCIARQPKCANCRLESICHAGDKTWSTVEIHKKAK